MWVVLYIAPNPKIADYLRQLLEREGIPVKINELVTATEGENSLELMVLESEVDEANALLNQALIRS